jgi:hypothetical protein
MKRVFIGIVILIFGLLSQFTLQTEAACPKHPDIRNGCIPPVLTSVVTPSVKPNIIVTLAHTGGN